MSKRDRAARAKGAAGADATDATVSADGADDAAGTDESTRPSGKRSAAPRGKRGAATQTDAVAEGGGVALKDRPKSTTTAQSRTGGNPIVRLWVFLRQVVAELRKVIWPTRREMIQYTIIVLIFVVVMTAFISGIDLGFAKIVLWMFG